MRLLWRGDMTDHRACHYSVENARLYTLPDADIPVIVSAFGERAAEVAARIGNGLWATSPQSRHPHLVGGGRRTGPSVRSTHAVLGGGRDGGAAYRASDLAERGDRVRSTQPWARPFHGGSDSRVMGIDRAVIADSQKARWRIRRASQLGQLRRELGGWLDAGGCTTEQRRDLLLTVNELATNGIEAAEGPSQASVVIDAWRDGSAVTIRVRNQGQPFAAPTPTMPDPWSPQGRGLAVAGSLSDRLVVEPLIGGTEASVRLDLR